ncbi:ribonuclease H-like domain-containing protein [Syncephalis plumigaleata]|nr:ribonuclease H-like domain-containing protein [Syncephalis plumigaleata]
MANTHSISNPLVWVDCEMTGLDKQNDHIIEIAVLITDGDLNIVAEGPELIIHQPKSIMDTMNEWCREHHGASGLTAAVLASKISMTEAQHSVLDFVKRYIPKARTAPLAGNSVHADRVFLAKDMPELEAHLHYVMLVSIIVCSTIKELCRRWYPDCSPTHHQNVAIIGNAMDDIKESLKELQYYRTHCFRE